MCKVDAYPVDQCANEPAKFVFAFWCVSSIKAIPGTDVVDCLMFVTRNANYVNTVNSMDGIRFACERTFVHCHETSRIPSIAGQGVEHTVFEGDPAIHVN